MNFVVAGAGAWGTGFTVHLARAGHRVALVPRRADQAADLAARRENVEYLPGIALPAGVVVTPDLAVALRDAEAVFLACPAQALSETVRRLGGAMGSQHSIRFLISLAKGLEVGTHRRPSEVIAEAIPNVLVGSLTGPTNALGVARGDPSAMVLAAARRNETVERVQAAISGPTLRAYTTDDLPGVEFGGCLKNIYAIAAGCCDGLKFGDNTKAALLTRALTEMVRVGVSLGARAETFYGLSGFGDLVATCYGAWSRNRQFGQHIGEGRTVADLLAHRKTVVEGYKTTDAFASLCDDCGIDAPILREVHAILSAGKQPAAALASLMTRELKAEHVK
jgi:glycerol-3-phosphate dehydrogenase (NAD(P)+)